jgi:phosphoribosylformimino-5-aminoimidazole carboxamide ribotide isomerase
VGARVNIYPAIDLMGGQAVRLVRGAAETKEVVGDPHELAVRFAAAPMLHVVDLDGAFAGKPMQLELITALAMKMKIEVGGGVRTMDDLERLFGAGIERAVLGTAAVGDPKMLAHALARFGPERIVVAVDVKEGFVATAGWTTTSAVRPDVFAKTLVSEGVKYALCTGVHKDGTMEGPDTDVMREVAASGLLVIASGGIGTLDHVRACREFHAVVVGKALYAGRFTLAEALAC